MIMSEFQLSNCKGDIGFLIDGSRSIIIGSGGIRWDGNSWGYDRFGDLEYNWDLILNFILVLAKNTDISQNGTRMAVVVFSEKANLEIKFSDHQNYESFESAVLALVHPESLTNTLTGFEVALNDMFDESTGMRPNPVPKTLIYLTDGRCEIYDCDPIFTDLPDECRTSDACLPDECRKYRNCQEKRFAEWGKRFEDRNIRKIGIGISLGDNTKEIVDFVGEPNFFRKNSFNEILTEQFRSSLSICDSKYLTLMKLYKA